MREKWFDFQEDIKDHFMNLGCKASTNVRLKGVRTSHDVDVLVESKFIGHDVKWIVEAKKWKSKVSKLHVMGLRQIVDDLGVDKGFVISEAGFQSGSVEAAKNTNISLLTFEELKLLTDDVFHLKILGNYNSRVSLIVNRYFSHQEHVRIKYGLKPDENIFDEEVDVYLALFTSVRAVKVGLRNSYPIDLNSIFTNSQPIVDNFYQLVNWLDRKLYFIEKKIFLAEIEMQKNKDFNPDIWFSEGDENVHMRLLEKISMSGD